MLEERMVSMTGVATRERGDDGPSGAKGVLHTE